LILPLFIFFRSQLLFKTVFLIKSLFYELFAILIINESVCIRKIKSFTYIYINLLNVLYHNNIKILAIHNRNTCTWKMRNGNWWTWANRV